MSDTDFARAIEEASKLPELPEELASQIPDILSGRADARMASRVDVNEPGRIPNSTAYDFEYNCARLVIGPVSQGFHHGKEEFSDYDDSSKLKEVMDANLSAKAIILKKTESFLKSGAVVIWLEWMTPKKKKPRGERDWLEYAELHAPELPDNDSGNSEEELI